MEEKTQSSFFESKNEENLSPEGEELHGDMDNISHVGDSDDYIEIDEDDSGSDDLFEDPFDDLDEDYEDDDEGNYF